MSGLRVRVLGDVDLKKEVSRLIKDLDEVEDPAAMAAAVPIWEKWRELVPVLEGHYRDSLTIVWLKAEQKAGIGTRWLPYLERNDQPVIYSKTLEFGDSDAAARPSQRPALKASRQAAIDAGAVPIKAVVKGRRPRKRVPTT